MKIFEKSQIPTLCPASPNRRHYIDRCIITIVIIIFKIIIFDLMRSLNLTPSGIPLGLRMFCGPFLARAINRGYYTVGGRYEFYFPVFYSLAALVCKIICLGTLAKSMICKLETPFTSWNDCIKFHSQ